MFVNGHINSKITKERGSLKHFRMNKSKIEKVSNELSNSFEVEQVISESNIGESPAMTLTNYYNKVVNVGNVSNKTSENLIRLIGQTGYDTVLLALCSDDQELKIKAIRYLLTEPKHLIDISTQTEAENNEASQKEVTWTKKVLDKSSQTDILTPEFMFKTPLKRRRIRKQVGPYVVAGPQQKLASTLFTQEKKINKIVIHPNDFNAKMLEDDAAKRLPIQYNAPRENIPRVDNSLAEALTDDDSRWSIGSLSNYSVTTDVIEGTARNLLNLTDQHTDLPDQSNFENILYNTEMQARLENDRTKTTNNCLGQTNQNLEPLKQIYEPIKQNYEPQQIFETVKHNDCGFRIVLWNGSTIEIPVKPEDQFHLATPEILAKLPPLVKQKLLYHQAFVDWKFCLQSNEDNNLPIHEAILANDVEFLRRQCVVLKAKQESVDITTYVEGVEHLSALHMGILHSSSLECIEMLLQHGADPLNPDEEEKTALHHAAESSNVEYLRVLLAHCKANARKVLIDNDLWTTEMDGMTQDMLVMQLFLIISIMHDAQGYSPLMLASKMGHHNHVKELLLTSSDTVNTGMPNSGNTALYLAVEAAYIDASERGNKSKISQNFKYTIEYLIEYGADPIINNFSGSNVNVILMEFGVQELSVLVAQKLLTVRNKPVMNNCKTKKPTTDDLILVRNGGRTVSYSEFRKTSNPDEEVEKKLDTKKEQSEIKIDKIKITNNEITTSNIKITNNVPQSPTNNIKLTTNEIIPLTPKLQPTKSVIVTKIVNSNEKPKFLNIQRNKPIRILPKSAISVAGNSKYVMQHKIPAVIVANKEFSTIKRKICDYSEGMQKKPKQEER